jgi:hypothetical protein
MAKPRIPPSRPAYPAASLLCQSRLTVDQRGVSAEVRAGIGNSRADQVSHCAGTLFPLSRTQSIMPLPRFGGQPSYHSLKSPSDREINDAIEVLQRAAVAYKIPASAIASASSQAASPAEPSVTVQSLFSATAPVSGKPYELWTRAERDAIFEKMTGLTGTLVKEQHPPKEAHEACCHVLLELAR